jgi:hypothetical protein
MTLSMLLWSTALPAWILLAITARGLWVANKSLKVLARQTDAQMNAERAWLLVTGVVSPELLCQVNNPEYIPEITYHLEVAGRTPARVTNSGFRFHILPAKAGTIPPQPDLAERRDYRSVLPLPAIPKTVLAPSTKFDVVSAHEDGSVNSVIHDSLEANRFFMCAYGFIEYEDAFKRKGVTRFCFVYRIKPGWNLRDDAGHFIRPNVFEVGGPESYTETI